MNDQINRREAIRRTSILMGGALCAGTVASIMSGCSRQTGLDWTPEFLTEDQARTISAMAQTVFPKTETPGAAEAGVGSFIDLTLKNHWEADRSEAFVKGIEQFMADAKETFGKSFVKMHATDQREFLTELELEAKAIMDNREERKNLARTVVDWQGKPFFRMFKELACSGYFSSEAVAKNYFVYDPIPGGYTGCVDFDEVGAELWPH